MNRMVDRSANVNGRPYARKSEVTVGTWLQADGDFTCIKKGAVLQVKRVDKKLFVDCDEVAHGLEAEGPRGKEYYMGFHLASADDVAVREI